MSHATGIANYERVVVAGAKALELSRYHADIPADMVEEVRRLAL